MSADSAKVDFVETTGGSSKMFWFSNHISDKKFFEDWQENSAPIIKKRLSEAAQPLEKYKFVTSNYLEISPSQLEIPPLRLIIFVNPAAVNSLDAFALLPPDLQYTK